MRDIVVVGGCDARVIWRPGEVVGDARLNGFFDGELRVERDLTSDICAMLREKKTS